ncbi:MAG: hypothetical protein JWR05_1806, partial [Mucilaginibacter sp.]|nr:hypothetical protein [Mucilaginibacter sp.]
ITPLLIILYFGIEFDFIYILSNRQIYKFIRLYLNLELLHLTKMKRDLIKGIILISAVVLSSCSVNKLSSSKNSNDDVYFSNATAGEEPEYAVQQRTYRQDEGDQYSDDNDYYYYDDYASRINRFSYFSPFGYYDYAYSPYMYGSGFGYGYSPFGYGYSPFGYGLGYGYGGLGFGFGGYYGYGGLGYGLGLGYGYGYSPYSYWGTGYGGGGYWGPVSANNSYGPRPNRGNGSPGSSIGVPRTAYSGRVASVGNAGYYSGRPNRVGNPGSSSLGRPGNYGSTGSARPARTIREDRPQYSRPQQQPNIERAPQPSYSPPPSSSGGGGGSSSGGGGGRPVRP